MRRYALLMPQQKPERMVIVTEDKLEGDLTVPAGAQAIILFAHGNGSSRYSTRNQYVAQVLNDAGFATLLVDLLTQEEKKIDELGRHLRFDVDLLARRFSAVTRWISEAPETMDLRIGYFGSSTGAAAALIAASELGDMVKAVVSRGGRPDLVDSRNIFERISAATLLVVGGNDTPIIALNKGALRRLKTSCKDLAIIPGAGHLFEEPGRMEMVAKIAVEWFESHLLGARNRFENRYGEKMLGLSSFFKKPEFRLKFKDRIAAGNMLAPMLAKYDDGTGMTVIGIPRGGAIVAGVVAKRLSVDFDIVVPRKLRAQDNSENAIGAIMQDGSIYLDKDIIESSRLSNEYLEGEKRQQKREVDRRLALYRLGSQEYKIKNMTVILVDDGAATGATAIAAARWIKSHKPKKLVIAVPVASPRARQLLEKEADDIEIIRCPSNFKTVESFYRVFNPISDQEIVSIQREMGVIQKSDKHGRQE